MDESRSQMGIPLSVRLKIFEAQRLKWSTGVLERLTSTASSVVVVYMVHSCLYLFIINENKKKSAHTQPGNMTWPSLGTRGGRSLSQRTFSCRSRNISTWSVPSKWDAANLSKPLSVASPMIFAAPPKPSACPPAYLAVEFRIKHCNAPQNKHTHPHTKSGRNGRESR